jgi:hypothetical protein
MRSSLFLGALVGFLSSAFLTDAFHGTGQHTKTHSTRTTGGFSFASSRQDLCLAVTRRTTMFAMKKKDEEKKIEMRQVTDPLELFILYATPWRNPNSIFVYLFLGLYALGTYSEAHRGM